MIKFLPLLLIVSLLHGKNSDYLLPDHNALFSRALENAVKYAQSEILVITPSFAHTELKRAALEALKRGSHMTLIVQSLKPDPLSLAQYEGIDVRMLGGRKLEGSVIVVDRRYLCTIPGPIDSENFSRYASLIRCSDDTASAESLHIALKPLIQRSKPYLK